MRRVISQETERALVAMLRLTPRDDTPTGKNRSTTKDSHYRELLKKEYGGGMPWWLPSDFWSQPSKICTHSSDVTRVRHALEKLSILEVHTFKIDARNRKLKKGITAIRLRTDAEGIRILTKLIDTDAQLKYFERLGEKGPADSDPVHTPLSEAFRTWGTTLPPVLQSQMDESKEASYRNYASARAFLECSSLDIAHYRGKNVLTMYSQRFKREKKRNLQMVRKKNPDYSERICELAALRELISINNEHEVA